MSNRKYPDNYQYIAIIERAESGTVGVYFPDLPGCTTCADSTEEAIKKAGEALSLHLYGMEQDGEAIPDKSELEALELSEGEIPFLVEVFMKPFRERMDTRFVKKTLSIPNWLNTEAEHAGVNFSAVLQQALKDQLGIREIRQ